MNDNENTTLNTELSPYIGTGQLPSPDMTAIGNSTDWFRGILYYSDGAGSQYLAVTIRGIAAATQCPQISSVELVTANSTVHNGGISCRYNIVI